MGARIAEPLLPWLGPWGHAIEQHHERYGGGGYPHALSGAEISLSARIVSVADSFEVMTAARSYKKPMSVPAARRELAACAGEQFDPAIVRAFLSLSLGRLWWTVGPMSWTALAPILGPVQRASGQLAAAATGATAAVVVGAAGLLPVMTGTAAASGPVAPARVSADPSAGPASAHDFVADDDVRTGGIGSGAGTGGGGDHADVPGSGSGSGEDPGGGGGSGGGDGGGGVVDVDPPGETLDDVVGGATQAVDDVVDGAGETVSGLVDGTTDVIDDVLGGVGASDILDEPVEDITDLLGGLLG
jgi:hypothetical protein